MSSGKCFNDVYPLDTVPRLRDSTVSRLSYFKVAFNLTEIQYCSILNEFNSNISSANERIEILARNVAEINLSEKIESDKSKFWENLLKTVDLAYNLGKFALELIKH